ncbi:hypothetical protein AVEN_270487-1 [Araneus ventricosus]|uniref:Uncharacterized protein n=1 Tax=Araneus ventricosus TaxID=182803 RepID=A0A4Y2B4B2_ARAVE|nr:hypothetical protein AVEN_270487-1 [Araneus ventricosus]
MYSERINDINHLKQRITDVIHSVTPDVLTRVWEELDYRLDVCGQQMEPTSNCAEQNIKRFGEKLSRFNDGPKLCCSGVGVRHCQRDWRPLRVPHRFLLSPGGGGRAA